FGCLLYNLAGQTDGQEPAVQQQQRLALPVDLVVVVDAVARRDVAGARRLLGGGLGGCRQQGGDGETQRQYVVTRVHCSLLLRRSWSPGCSTITSNGARRN